MGCDIHMYVEVKGWGDADGKEWQMAMTEVAAYGNRNYDVFSALAGVRNYGDPAIQPISEPRGLPHDVSAPVAQASASDGPDGHSHSWLLLAEVLSYDWASVTHAGHFPEWAKSLTTGPTRMEYDGAEAVRLVFWFDN